MPRKRRISKQKAPALKPGEVCAVDVAHALLERTGAISPSRLQTMLYLAQIECISHGADTLFADGVAAWRRGIVIDSVQSHCRGKALVSSDDFPEAHNLDGAHMLLLDEGIRPYVYADELTLNCKLNANALWKRSMQRLRDDALTTCPIPIQAMRAVYA